MEEGGGGGRSPKQGPEVDSRGLEHKLPSLGLKTNVRVGRRDRGLGFRPIEN